MTPSRGLLYGLVGWMTFLWGINYVMAKIGLTFFPPLLFGPLRALSAAMLMIPLFLWNRRRKPHVEMPWTREELPALIFLGVCGIALNQILFIVGMSRTSVTHAALIVAMTPVLVLLLARLRGLEEITARKASGMAIAIGGVAVLNVGPGKDAHGATMLGDVLIFMAALTFALFAVSGKEITRRHDTITVNTFGYAAGAVAVLPLLVWEARGFDFVAVPVAGWWTLLYMALFPSIICYMIFYYAMKWLPASRVAAFSYAQPVVAAVAGFVVLSEPVTATVAAGGALVLCGVWLTSRR